MSEESTSPADMYTAAGQPAIAWGLRAAVCAGQADGRRPPFRVARVVAVAIVTAEKGTEPISSGADHSLAGPKRIVFIHFFIRVPS